MGSLAAWLMVEYRDNVQDITMERYRCFRQSSSRVAFEQGPGTQYHPLPCCPIFLHSLLDASFWRGSCRAGNFHRCELGPSA